MRFFWMLGLVLSLGFVSPARAVTDSFGLLDAELTFSAPSDVLGLATPRVSEGGLLPCALSFVIPGLGQLFNGQFLRAGFFFGSTAVLTILAVLARSVPVLSVAFGVVGVGVWAIGVADAYSGGTSTEEVVADASRPVLVPFTAAALRQNAAVALSWRF